MYAIKQGNETLETTTGVSYVRTLSNGKNVLCEKENAEYLYSSNSDKLYDIRLVRVEELPISDLDARKEKRIAQSKDDLESYLLTHPLQWTDGEYYAITQDKQNQLTSKIMAATMAQTLSADYTLTWNSTGEVCRAWTLSDLSALAFAIDARVTKLVSYQQAQEVAMRAAATLEELDAIEVDYDTVP